MIETLKKVEGNPSLFRDDSNAILETDNGALAAYRKRREQQVEYSNMRVDLHNIKEELSEMKILLRRALG
jgi:hypothetical protein